MTKIDDMNVGDFFTVIEDREINVRVNEWLELRNLPIDYNGNPHKLIAIGLPFIVCKDLTNGEILAIDTRRYVIQKVSKAYVTALFSGATQEQNGNVHKEVKPTTTNICPCCGYSLVETKRAAEKDWKLVCRVCHFEGKINRCLK